MPSRLDAVRLHDSMTRVERADLSHDTKYRTFFRIASIAQKVTFNTLRRVPWTCQRDNSDHLSRCRAKALNSNGKRSLYSLESPADL